jgi:hypothetical protein
MWEVHAFAKTAWGRLGRFLDRASANDCADRAMDNWTRVRVVGPDGEVVWEQADETEDEDDEEAP